MECETVLNYLEKGGVKGRVFYHERRGNSGPMKYQVLQVLSGNNTVVENNEPRGSVGNVSLEVVVLNTENTGIDTLMLNRHLDDKEYSK